MLNENFFVVKLPVAVPEDSLKGILLNQNLHNVVAIGTQKTFWVQDLLHL